MFLKRFLLLQASFSLYVKILFTRVQLQFLYPRLPFLSSVLLLFHITVDFLYQVTHSSRLWAHHLCSFLYVDRLWPLQYVSYQFARKLSCERIHHVVTVSSLLFFLFVAYMAYSDNIYNCLLELKIFSYIFYIPSNNDSRMSNNWCGITWT